MQSQDSNENYANLFKQQEQNVGRKGRKQDQKLQELEFNDDDQQEQEFEDSEDNSDDDDDDGSEDEDSRGPDRKKNKKKKKKSGKKNKKRKAKKGVEAFFDNQAYESSVDEEEDDDDEFAEAELRDVDAKKKTEQYYRKSRKNEGLLELLKGKDEDEVNEIMQRRNYNQYVGDLNSPSLKDPKVYQIPVVKGKQESLTLAILNKASQLQKQMQEGKKMTLAICSVMCMKRKFPGYIFVEAMNESDVKHSLQGFLDIMPREMQIIKDDQYQNLFKQKDAPTTNIKELEYVRIRGGRYDGDLGKIFKVRKNGFQVILQPRIDKAKLLNQIRYITDSETITEKQKHYSRIIKKHFSNKDIVVHKSRPDKSFITNDQLPNIQIARKPKLTHEGMIILTFAFAEVTKQIVSITTKEVDLFKKDDSLMEFARKQLRYLSSTINIAKGDEVEVIHGDIKGVYGIVLQVKDKIAVIQAKNNPRLGVFQQHIDKLAKKFRLKQMVSVITGNYKDRIGRILTINNHQATILTENNNEIIVNTNNLKLSDGILNTQQTVLQFHKNDLVLTLGIGDGVGMVLSASRDSLTILDLNNSIRVVSVMDVDKKLDTKNNKAINIYKEEIRQGAIVRIIDGKYGGKKVEVKHIHKNNLFVTSNQIGLHGAHVIKDTNCTLITQSAVKPKFFFHNHNQSNNQKPSTSTTTTTNNSNPKNTSNKEQDELPRGKIITIKCGEYKGYQGQIINCANDKVEVKLTAKLGKKVMIKKDDILAQTKGGDYGKTPRVSGSSYVPASPAGIYQSRRDRDYS